MNAKIAEFISHARSQGLDFATIRVLLQAAGWNDKQIARALAATELEVSVPEPGGIGNARNAFLYLMTFGTLYAMVISLIVLFFQYLDWLLPDVAFEVWERPYILSSIRWSLAVLLVTVPLYCFLLRVTQRAIEQEADDARDPFRAWLTYFTLFIAAIVVTGDLVALLYMFLEGELSTRFVAKVGVLLLIAGTVYWYYLSTLRPHDSPETSPPRRLFLAALGVAVAIAVAGGFYLVESPFTVRLRRLDERRVEDLRSIRDAIRRMVTRREDDRTVMKRELPEALDEVGVYVQSEEYTQALTLADPQTGEPYGYQRLDDHRYELRATFSLSRDRRRDMFWNHPAGSYRFECDALDGD